MSDWSMLHSSIRLVKIEIENVFGSFIHPHERIKL